MGETSNQLEFNFHVPDKYVLDVVRENYTQFYTNARREQLETKFVSKADPADRLKVTEQFRTGSLEIKVCFNPDPVNTKLPVTKGESVRLQISREDAETERGKLVCEIARTIRPDELFADEIGVFLARAIFSSVQEKKPIEPIPRSSEVGRVIGPITLFVLPKDDSQPRKITGMVRRDHKQSFLADIDENYGCVPFESYNCYEIESRNPEQDITLRYICRPSSISQDQSRNLREIAFVFHGQLGDAKVRVWRVFVDPVVDWQDVLGDFSKLFGDVVDLEEEDSKRQRLDCEDTCEYLLEQKSRKDLKTIMRDILSKAYSEGIQIHFDTADFYRA